MLQGHKGMFLPLCEGRGKGSFKKHQTIRSFIPKFKQRQLRYQDSRHHPSRRVRKILILLCQEKNSFAVRFFSFEIGEKKTKNKNTGNKNPFSINQDYQYSKNTNEDAYLFYWAMLLQLQSRTDSCLLRDKGQVS